jgi:anthranilate phosphoribosyltransferase
LGVKVELSPAQIARNIDEIGIGFMFARSHHPAMRHVAAVRAEIGVRTLFNVLGPLSNPAAASHQLVGVPEPHLIGTLAKALAALGSKRAWVVHGQGALDELSLGGSTLVAQLEAGTITEFEVTPEAFGLLRQPHAQLRADDCSQSAAVIRAVLAGERGAARDVVILNAAAGLHVAGREQSFVQAARLAAEAIDSGAAARKLAAWAAASQAS